MTQKYPPTNKKTGKFSIKKIGNFQILATPLPKKKEGGVMAVPCLRMKEFLLPAGSWISGPMYQ